MTAPVREGEILAGKYRVDRVLGVGGMGVVVAAHHIQLDERVALKFLLPEALGNQEAVARFAREARAAVKIKSEHVARVSDVGTLENGAPYIVMEYLQGSDLSAWITERGTLPVEQAVEFILQACEAIAEAHALGIVHRDLKPANLFVIRRPDGGLSVKVLDFGISKMTSVTGSAGDGAMTKTSAMMGSPLYMSPEQIRSSKDVDSRTDIWSLGVILYELVTGECPFVADTLPELVYRIMSAPAAPVRVKRPDAPEGLESVMARCLDKDRGKRFESVGEMALALLPFGPKRSKGSVERISGVMRAAGMSATALKLPPSSDQTSLDQQHSGTAASWGKTNPSPSGGRRVAFGVAGVVLVGIVAVLLLRPAPKAPLPEPVVAATAMVAPAIAAPIAPAAAAAAPTTLPSASSVAAREAVVPAHAPIATAAPEHKATVAKPATKPAHAPPPTPSVPAPSPAPAPAAAIRHNPLDIQPQ